LTAALPVMVVIKGRANDILDARQDIALSINRRALPVPVARLMVIPAMDAL
jgi:hypothetical protein